MVITMDDIYKFTDFGFVCESYDYPATPKIEHHAIHVPGQAGLYYLNTDILERLFKFSLARIDKNKEQLQVKIRNLISFLFDSKGQPRQIKIVFDYEPNKYYLVKCNSDIPVERVLRTGKLVILFAAYDPFAYSTGSKTINIVDSIIGINQGSCPTKGIITIEINESISFIEVTLLNTGEFIRLEDDFIQGDVIKIDLKKEYVTKNDISEMTALFLESDFFSIPIGEFELMINSGTATLEYTERWL